MTDVTAPTIELGLADPDAMDRLLPLPNNGSVRPDATGMVRFRARLKDSGAGVRNAVMQVMGSSASFYGSPTHETYLGAAVDCKRRANGATLKCQVDVWDYAGNKATLTRTFLLQKGG